MTSAQHLNSYQFEGYEIYEDDIDESAIYEDADGDNYEEPDDVGEGPSGKPNIIYTGGNDIPGIKMREQLAREYDEKLYLKTREDIRDRRPVYFMPTDVEESQDYENGKRVYKLHAWGALIDGTKAHVIFDAAKVFFDILVPDKLPMVGNREQTLEEFGMFWRKELHDAGIHDFSIDTTPTAFPIRGYRTAPVRYIRVSTPDTQKRKEAIDLVRGRGLTTANDDTRSYYRKVAREAGETLADWLVLSNYKYAEGRGVDNKERWTNDPVSSHIFKLSIDDAKPIVNPLDSEEKRAKQSEVIQNNPALLKDRTLVIGWDIEAYSPNNLGELPNPENPEDVCFMIAVTAHWKDSPDPLYQIVFIDKECHPDARWTTVVCGNGRNVIRAFFIAWRYLAPDGELAFNSGDFDWPFVIEKARQYGDLVWIHRQISAIPRKTNTEDDVYKWNFNNGKPRPVKITAEANHAVRLFKVPGCVPIDVRMCFMKLYPKSEVSKGSSLNFYLKACKLPSKADMPVPRMWRYYKNGDLEGLRKVAHYCVIDALRCNQLMVKRVVINEGREVAALAFCTLSDSILYAGGVKVCNLLLATSNKRKRKIFCSNITQERKEEGKYPGAWVFDPKKGLHNDRPVTGVDAASLYPSIIMTYNISPEMIVKDETEARALMASGVRMHYIEFVYNGRTRRAWCVRHDNDPEKYGLYPEILMDLFARRKALKKKLGVLKMKKECLELIMGEAKKAKMTFAGVIEKVLAEIDAEIASTASNKDLEEKNRELKAQASYIREVRGDKSNDTVNKFITAEYDAVCFEYVKTDTKQKAVKIFMNTFYGEAGNALSPFFELEVAGGVTAGGQTTIKKAVQFALERGMIMIYGDTDSMYLKCPDKHYADCDKRYKNGEINKEQWWTEMVKITMIVMNAFINELNAFLKQDNGTSFLSFAYEDVLFPVAFTGKKKYFGIAHVSVPNFHPKELFIRGIDVVKVGQTKLSQSVGYKIMWEAVSIDNEKSLRTIVEIAIKDAATNVAQWTFDYFVQTDSYKPNKDNKSVKRFIARMKPRRAQELAENKTLIAAGKPPKKQLYELPEPAERFSYVITKKSEEFDLRGRRYIPKKGDLMEFAHVARELQLPVDVAYYLVHYVVGLCARFINYDAQFQPAAQGLTAKEIDQQAQKVAVKYLKSIVDGCSGIDRKVVTAQGRALRRAFKIADKHVRDETVLKVGVGSFALQGNQLSFDVFLDNDAAENTTEGDRSASKVQIRAKEYGEAIIAANTDIIINTVMQRLGMTKGGYDLVADDAKTVKNLVRFTAKPRKGTTREELKRHRYECLRREQYEALSKVMPKMVDIATRYEIDLKYAVDLERKKQQLQPDDNTDCGVNLSLDDDDRATLSEFRNIWYMLAGIYGAVATDEKVREFLEDLRKKRIATKPSPSEVRTAASQMPVPKLTGRNSVPIGFGAINA